MKRSILLLIFMTFIPFARANIAPPKAWISEILVDSSGNWTIEMGFYMYDNYYMDSIRVVTSSGSSLIANYSLIPGDGSYSFDSLSVITKESLVQPVSINPAGDIVKLISYLSVWDENTADSVIFGDYPGSKLGCMQDDASVMYVVYYVGPGFVWGFGIDSTPTIGIANDTIGAMGNFSGILYDLDGNPFTGGFFTLPFLHDMVIHLNTDGTFSERVLSHRVVFDTITLRLPESDYVTKIFTVEPVDFCLYNDSSHYQDIITTSLVIGVEETEKPDDNTVTVAPNPFSDKIDFYFSLKNQQGENEFTIYSLDGKKILQVSLDEDQKKFEWHPSAEIPSGTYIYRLEKDNTIVKTGKFVRY